MLENRFSSSAERHPAQRPGCGREDSGGLEENGPPAPGPLRSAVGPSVFFHCAATCRRTPRAARAGTGYSAERGRRAGCAKPASAPQDSRSSEQHPQERPRHLPAPRCFLKFPNPRRVFANRKRFF